MTDFSSILLSYGILLSGLLVTVGVMYVLLKHRDATVKLPVDREQLTRIPAYGLQALGYQVFHDVQADGFNIDHLVIGKNGVFAIETKGRHKRNKDLGQTNGNGPGSGKKGYQVFYKDGRLNFPSWTETKPIEQAERQAKWVSQWLTKATGTPVSSIPVLVFPGWFVTSQSKPPFPHLCYKELNHKQLVSTIPTLKTQALTQQQVDTIIYQVAQRCLSKSEMGK